MVKSLKNKFLIIGSTAIYHWFSDFRIPKDIDLLSPIEIKSSNNNFCFIDSSWHSAAESIIQLNKNPIFADPDILLTLKVSHAHWNIKWDKTIFDINFLLSKGCKLNESLYEKLINVWEIIHGKSKVKLNQKIDDFFNDVIIRKYNHEKLHELVAFNNEPMHIKIRKDPSNALCDYNLFNNLSIEQQLETALEEIIVVAIERGQLTKNNKKSEIYQAVKKSHFKLCTSMTKGWFALFLILNHNKLIFERKEKWMNKINQVIKKF